jgi:hypothetical protein
MIAVLLGLLAAGLAVAGGAPWWTLLLAAPYAIPGRLGPAIGAFLVVLALPWGAGELWKDALFLSCGLLAGWGTLHRIGHAVPWVAVPWWLGGFAALEVLWRVAPPAGYWTGSDLTVRLRILVVAAAMAVGFAAHYLPRYRNEASSRGSRVLPAAPGPGGGGGGAPDDAGGGTAGARPDRR